METALLFTFSLGRGVASSPKAASHPEAILHQNKLNYIQSIKGAFA